MPSIPGVEAIVFDLGGVLVDVDFRRALARWAAASGVPAETLAARFQRDAAFCAHECGTLDDPGYFAHLRSTLGMAITDEALLAGWNAALGKPLPGIESLVARLSREFPLYVFSNTNPAHIAHFTPRYAGLLGFFRKIITSCDLGARKPEAEAFARVAKPIGVTPGRILFFDDLEENVAGARAAGLQAYRAASVQQIESVIAQKRSAR